MARIFHGEAWTTTWVAAREFPSDAVSLESAADCPGAAVALVLYRTMRLVGAVSFPAGPWPFSARVSTLAAIRTPPWPC